ncbi:hypothetical protein b3_0381 [Synechococcus phage B3]|nr:hypothetical protein b3_0381 [Synechococcus phage B3]
MTQTATRKPRTTASAAKKVSLDLPANPFQHEILELACKQKTKAKKIEVLQKYANDALTSLIIWNYDETVITLLPFGDVPYSKVADILPGNSTLTESITHQIDDKMVDAVGGNQRTTLRTEYTKFHNFIQGGNNTLSTIRRETIFIQLLEGLHPKEAEIVCLVKDKKLATKYNLSFDLIKEAYPHIVWGGRS